MSEAKGETGTPDGATAGFAGLIDGIFDGMLTGWALDPAGVPCRITILANGREIATVDSTGPRPDLVAAGFSKELGGWAVPIAALLKDASNTIEARFPDGSALGGSPIRDVAPQAIKLRYTGAVDNREPPIISGWAVTSTRDSAPVTIEIEGQDPITVQADNPRPDLAAGGMSNGLGGWNFRIAELLKPGANRVRVRFPDGSELPGSPLTIEHEAAPGAPKASPRYRGAIDTPGPVWISGWAVGTDHAGAAVSIAINDGPALTVAADGQRPDLVSAGESSGDGGWQLDLSGLLAPGHNRIDVRFPDGFDVPGSPVVFDHVGAPHRPKPAPATSAAKQPAATQPVQYNGAIDTKVGPNLTGWSVGGGTAAPVTVVINGGEPFTIAADGPRPDLHEGGMSDGSGGWSLAIADRLRPGSNVINLRFPDGKEFPGSPLTLGGDGSSSVAAPATSDDGTRALSLTELDEISIDDLVDVVASGLFEFPMPDRDDEPAPEPEVAPAPARPERRPGLLSRLLRRRSDH